MASKFPKSWSMVPVADLGEWFGGGTPSKSNPVFWNGDIPWVSPKDMKVGKIRDTIDHISKVAVEKSAAKLIPEDSVVVVTRSGILAHTFPVAVTDVQVTLNQDLKALQPAAGIDPDYIAWAFRGLQREILATCSKGGTTVHSIEMPRFTAFEVPTAPTNEQRRIVSKIEELFSEIDKGVESLKTAREQLMVYRQAVLKHAFEGKLTARWRAENKDELESADYVLVRIKQEREARYEQRLEEWKVAVEEWEAAGKQGPRPRKPGAFRQPRAISVDEMDLLPTIPAAWQFVRLGEIAEVGSGMSVSASRKIHDPIEVAYLRVANVQRGYLDLSEIKFMNIEQSKLAALKLKKWDVLFNEGGDRDKLGRGWIWQSEVEPCITQNHVFRASLCIPSETSAKILSHWGNNFGQGYFEKTGKQTTNLASINKTVLSEFPVPLISPAEQEEIQNQIDRVMTVIDSQEKEISAALERSDALRQSILKNAFSGKLVEQNSKDEPASVLLEQIKSEKSEQEKNNEKNNKRKDAA